MSEKKHEYLIWDKKTITDFLPANVSKAYFDGYVFTRIDRGVVYKTRSLRINLNEFELSSENRRILRKTEGLELTYTNLPIKAENYNWKIHKLGKDFYDSKFGNGTFSAAKIKQLVTNSESSNFNILFKYIFKEEIVGYVIAYQNSEMIHYSYPFYDLERYPSNFGMSMMIKAILWSKEHLHNYIYLGSASRPSDKYKLQFKGLEWFDEIAWTKDLEKLKQEISTIKE